ncbi:MAG: SPFH/Band 7/PHB domain protein, partial [Anaerolineae bacterium]|nr:SPFH/Band 7/PHB domain protein [Anaerolineae bacterium]
VKVTTVEIREITPPRDVQSAMNRQLAAERERRAMVTEADGKRAAAILVAEGERQATILRAEGDRQAANLRAQGFALALENIFNIARTIDDKTMSLQYLETLKNIGASPATKFVLPMEFTNLLRPFLGHTAQASDGKLGEGKTP